MDEDESRELSRWTKIMIGSENAPTAARNDAADKAIVERGTVRAWAESMSGEFGLQVDDLRAGGDPPDFNGRCDGQLISIELVQLVDADDRAPKRAQIKGKAEPPFDQRLWTPEKFRTRISATLDAKQAKYERKPAVFDVLIVHHEHGWLNAKHARDWLAAGSFEPRPHLRNAHLLLSYEPGWAKHRPLFRLYGEL
ncbi:MAG: hypothetical protein Q7U20_09245 [Caulobacter sp.]|nr:hypothetical protein [Caulobacter sp.]